LSFKYEGGLAGKNLCIAAVDIAKREVSQSHKSFPEKCLRAAILPILAWLVQRDRSLFTAFAKRSCRLQFGPKS
jgi:hypothetical protein